MIKPFRLACIHCASQMRVEDEAVTCPECGSHWERRDGIPRFVEPEYYWGEVPQKHACTLLLNARKNGWRAAVQEEFANDSDMLISILDWQQRASWLALLGLGKEHVVLDVGSGYGAITHALATVAGEVYSLEAMPERIEFTRTRLEQEQLLNVRLLQASAITPPLCGEMFDVIVVNGVLEWVGEWDQKGTPSSAQVRFLKNIHRLLKPGGCMILGIENRFGHSAFRGATDHSGLPYTSLMPRFLASIRLRYSQRAHHRTELNAKRQYRTYTYSELGYKKLLGRCGFRNASFYWADPGYNQPYHLIPLQTETIKYHLEMSLSQSHSPRSRWRRRAKQIFCQLGLMRAFVPEFLIIARKEKEEHTRQGNGLEQSFWRHLPADTRLKHPIFTLSTSPFREKSLIRAFESGGDNPEFVIKAAWPERHSHESLEPELDRVNLIRSVLQSKQVARLCVPSPLSSFTRGECRYFAEAIATGRQVSEVFSEQSRARTLSSMRPTLLRCIEAAGEIAAALRGQEEVELINPAWLEVPLSPSGIRPKELADSACVQHGDYTIENIFIELNTGTLTIIDWEHLSRGLPALYDTFSLLLSSLPVIEVQNSSDAKNLLEAQFLTAFFGNNESATLMRDLLLSACAQFAIPKEQAFAQFVAFLTIRSNYFAGRSRAMMKYHQRFLEIAENRRPDFIISPA